MNDMMPAEQQSSPVVAPPPSGTMFDMLPLPAFDRTLYFSRSGGDILKLIVSHAHGKGDGSSERKAHKALDGSSGVNGKSRAITSAVCRMVSSPGGCRWDPCMFLHASPLKDSSSPVALLDGGGGSPAAPGVGSRTLALRTGGAARTKSREGGHRGASAGGAGSR